VVGLLEPVLLDQMEIVPLVENLAAHLGVQLAKQPHFGVLLGYELLTHGRDLDVEVVLGQIEVGREVLTRSALLVPADGKGAWLVCPGDSVEVEEESELTLAVVSESSQFGVR
jgi:hypothetical protein